MKKLLGSQEIKAYHFLLVLTVISTIIFQLWRTLFNHFAVETLELGSQDIGLIQAVREVPGFLSFAVVYLILVIKEKWLAIISVLILVLGVGMTGFFPSKWGLLMTTFIMSIGFHFFETVNQSLSMQYFSSYNFPFAIAHLKRYGALAAIITGLCISLLTNYLDYKSLYILFALLTFFALFIAFKYLPSDKELPPQKKGLILKKRYSLYYALTFLNGARRQIFTVFALLLLVQRHQFTATTISLLFVLNNIVNFFIYPQIAKLILKYGEKRILRFEYTSLLFIFLMYAFVDYPWAALSLYIIDNLFFSLSMATKTYFQKIASPEDIAPSSGVSFTINHIAAVFIPFLGGILWQIDWKIPFYLAASLTVISFFLTHFIKIEKNHQ